MQYPFFGVVHPERAIVSILQLRMDIAAPSANLTGHLSVTVALSQITAVFKTDTPIDNPFTLKNYIEDFIRAIIDALGYAKGCGYDVEIIQMVDDVGNQPLVFGVGIPILAVSDEKSGQVFSDIVQLYVDERGTNLQRCLADLREAIRSPKDTGFFCYRAIESLRDYFTGAKHLSTDRQSWEILRDELGIERQDIDYIKRFADPLRHGSTKSMNDSERAQILRITWTVVDKYIAYAGQGYQKT